MIFGYNFQFKAPIFHSNNKPNININKIISKKTLILKILLVSNKGSPNNKANSTSNIKKIINK